MSSMTKYISLIWIHPSALLKGHEIASLIFYYHWAVKFNSSINSSWNLSLQGKGQYVRFKTQVTRYSKVENGCSETLSVKTISETCQNQKASFSTGYSFDSFQIPSAHFFFWKKLCLMQICSVLSTLTEQNSQEEHCNSDSFTASPHHLHRVSAEDVRIVTNKSCCCSWKTSIYKSNKTNFKTQDTVNVR